MFKTDPRLFLSANNNISSAKSFINECKRIVSEMSIDNDTDFANLKDSILSCDIDSLVTKVEETKESLFRLEDSFASEYMTLLQEYMDTSGIDTSNMSDEEKLQYSTSMGSYERDYNYCLLYTLEKYENTGMLTPELEEQLKIQRIVVERYSVGDKMDSLLATSQEYIDLYSELSNLDKNIINLMPNLSEEEKKIALANYDSNYVANLKILELNRDVSIKTEELKKIDVGSEEYYDKQNEIYDLQIAYFKGKESLTQTEANQLATLYDYKELNNLIKNDADFDEIYDKKVSMGIAVTEADTEYRNMDKLERLVADTKTFAVSTVMGIGSVTESVIDGGVSLVGGLCDLVGGDTKWAEDFVRVNYASDAYDGLALEGEWLSTAYAYSDVHTVGNILGNVAGGVFISLLPGGKYVYASVNALSAMGSSVQRSLNNGATFEEAFNVGKTASIASFFAGKFFNSTVSKVSSATSLLQVGKYAVSVAGVNAITPFATSISEYYNYANRMTDEDGNALYSDIWDYYVDSGGLKNSSISFATGLVSIGIRGYLNYRNNVKLNAESAPATDVTSEPKAESAVKTDTPHDTETSVVPSAGKTDNGSVEFAPWDPKEGCEMTYQDAQKVLSNVRKTYGDKNGIVDFEKLKANPVDYENWYNAMGSCFKSVPSGANAELKELSNWYNQAQNHAKYYGNLAKAGDQAAMVEYVKSVARIGGIDDIENCGVFVTSTASTAPSVAAASASVDVVPDLAPTSAPPVTITSTETMISPLDAAPLSSVTPMLSNAVSNPSVISQELITLTSILGSSLVKLGINEASTLSSDSSDTAYNEVIETDN